MNETPPLPYRWLLRWIKPYFFQFGFACSFATLVLAGRITSNVNIYGSNFKRFDLFLSPETLFYPTAKQLHALARSIIPNSQDHHILVVIGGSSILNGFGQNNNQLWTNELKMQLGDSFRILNLAVRSGNAQEGGALTVQSLIKDGYQNVLYVADTYPGIAGSEEGDPEGNSIHKYLFWDAYYKGLLLTNTKPSVLAANHRVSESDLEMQRISRLDSLLYFNDLWTLISYKYIFTVWNHVTAQQNPKDQWLWIKPRKQFQDQTTTPISLQERYPDANTDEIMSILRKDFCRKSFIQKQKEWIPITDFWRELNQKTQQLMPDQLKFRTIILVTQVSPHYINKLTFAERACWQKEIDYTVQLYQSNGFMAVSTGSELSKWDYADPIHIAPSGGQKLAKILAARIRHLADKLGYTKS